MGEFAGSLGQRIGIMRRSDDRTDDGLALGSWEFVGECRASILPEGIGQEAEGMALSVMPRMRFLIRTNNLVAVDRRIEWRGRTFLIKQVVENPRMPDRLELRCEEVRA